MYLRRRGFSLNVLRKYFLLDQVDQEQSDLIFLLFYLQSVAKREIMQHWNANESGSLKFIICIPFYNPYIGWITRAHIIHSKFSCRSERGRAPKSVLLDSFPYLFAFPTSRSLRQWPSYLYLSSGCNVPYLTKH